MSLVASDRHPFNYQVTKYMAHSRVVITIRELVESRLLGDLIWHDGFVVFGTSKRQVTSYVLCLNSEDDVVADKLSADLSIIASPYIVTPISDGRGVRDFAGHSFLAVLQFSSTLVPYISAQSRVTIDKERFTEEFIGIIRNVVNGILTLHSEGYCCRYLKPRHILVFTVGALKTAQIWNISRTASENVKSKDWTRLGCIIRDTAKAQLTSTVEINDLYTRLMDGSLKGLQVLKHSALLTVQEKFENILALSNYIEVHKVDQFQSASADQQAVANLKSFITATKYWRTKIPSWIIKTAGYQSRSGDKGGGFVLWLPDRVEHAFSFVPIKVPRPRLSLSQIFGTDPDLECVLRQTWPELYLEIQNLVAELDIHY